MGREFQSLLNKYEYVLKEVEQSLDLHNMLNVQFRFPIEVETMSPECLNKVVKAYCLWYLSENLKNIIYRQGLIINLLGGKASDIHEETLEQIDDYEKLLKINHDKIRELRCQALLSQRKHNVAKVSDELENRSILKKIEEGIVLTDEEIECIKEIASIAEIHNRETIN